MKNKLFAQVNKGLVSRTYNSITQISQLKNGSKISTEHQRHGWQISTIKIPNTTSDEENANQYHDELSQNSTTMAKINE